MALIDQAVSAQDTGLKLRVKVAIVGAAIAINGEAQGASSVAVWEARRDLAVQVLRSPDRWADLFVWGVAADSSIGNARSLDSVTDLAINNRVSAIWSDYAVRN